RLLDREQRRMLHGRMHNSKTVKSGEELIGCLRHMAINPLSNGLVSPNNLEGKRRCGFYWLLALPSLRCCSRHALRRLMKAPGVRSSAMATAPCMKTASTLHSKPVVLTCWLAIADFVIRTRGGSLPTTRTQGPEIVIGARPGNIDR